MNKVNKYEFLNPEFDLYITWYDENSKYLGAWKMTTSMLFGSKWRSHRKIKYILANECSEPPYEGYLYCLHWLEKFISALKRNYNVNNFGRLFFTSSDFRRDLSQKEYYDELDSMNFVKGVQNRLLYHRILCSNWKFSIAMCHAVRLRHTLV